MRIDHLVATGAALVPEADGIPMKNDSRGKAEPTGPFNWPSGYQKLAPCTMNTLFWAGNVFAPRMYLLCDTDGSALRKDQAINIQYFLQNAYIEAYAQLVEALTPCSALVGLEVRISGGTRVRALVSYTSL